MTVEEIKSLVKQLIQLNAGVYELLLDWIEANQDEGLRSNGIANKPINFGRAKSQITGVVDTLRGLSSRLEIDK